MLRFIFIFCSMLLGLASYAVADSTRIARLEEIAGTIRVQSPQKGEPKLQIPAVPAGYRLQLKGTDKLPVVDTTGNIGKALTDQKVKLYFVLTDIVSGDQKDVTDVEITVAGERSVVNGQNVRPEIIPALREWCGGEGTYLFPKEGSIIIDPAYQKYLQAGAEQLAADLKETGGLKYTVKTGKPENGVIYITLATDDRQLGKEGYRLVIGDDIRIEAVNSQGAFWATRTILQMLQQQGTELSKGTTRDYPKYARRGFMLDVARKYIPLYFLQDYVKIMSYYKMNEFHVHLNDNAFPQYFDNDWDKTYAAFRLESDFFPGLTAKDGSYKKKEFTALQRQGMLYGVNVVPEIDVPAHSLSFSHYRKSLGSQKYGMDHLDLSNPEIYPFLDSLFREYLEGPDPVFIGPEVHVGTDEYSKEVAEQFRAFTDHYIRYIQGFGKRARVWGALTHAKGETPVTVDSVIMNAWYNGYGDPTDMIKLGYDLISTPDGYLYIVPAAGYYYDYLNLKFLYEKWEPIMIGNQVFPFGHPQVLGGTFAVWNDHSGNGITVKDIHDRAFPAMQVLAQKMWDGGEGIPAYDKFHKLALNMPEAPGVNIAAKVASKSNLVLHYEPQKAEVKDLSGNNYHAVKTHKLKVDKKDGMVFGGRTEVELPVEEIGYDYIVRFDLQLDEFNPKDAVLFKSPAAVVVVNESESGMLAFKREGYCYYFDYAPQPGIWANIAIRGDAKGTSLYVDGELVQRLEGKKKVVKDKRGKESVMHIQQTLVFPLQQIGDAENGFKGKIRKLQVFNEK